MAEAINIYVQVNVSSVKSVFYAFQAGLHARMQHNVASGEEPHSKIDVVKLFEAHVRKTAVKKILKLDVDTKDPLQLKELVSACKTKVISFIF